jgi:hypothetical protein
VISGIMLKGSCGCWSPCLISGLVLVSPWLLAGVLAFSGLVVDYLEKGKINLYLFLFCFLKFLRVHLSSASIFWKDICIKLDSLVERPLKFSGLSILLVNLLVSDLYLDIYRHFNLQFFFSIGELYFSREFFAFSNVLKLLAKVLAYGYMCAYAHVCTRCVYCVWLLPYF